MAPTEAAVRSNGGMSLQHLQRRLRSSKPEEEYHPANQQLEPESGCPLRLVENWQFHRNSSFR